MLRLLVLLFVFFVPLLAAETLHVAVASNFRAPLEELRKDIEQELGVNLVITAASTGKLATQILQGAPFDVFLTADNSTHLFLMKRGRGHIYMPYTKGQLALYAYQPLPAYSSLNTLFDDAKIQRVAIANPKLSPYGFAAQSALQEADINFGRKKIVAENVAQAFHYVKAGHADLGFVSYSSLLLSETHPKYYSVLDENSYPTLEQYMLVLNSKKVSMTFASFIMSDLMQTRIKKMGYLRAE